MCMHQVRSNTVIQNGVFLRNLSRFLIVYFKCCMKILLWDFNAKVERENIFKLPNGNESPHQKSCNNSVRMVNLATSKNVVVKSTMFLHQNIHKYSWTSPNGNAHNQMDNILIERRWHSIVLDIHSFMVADCDTDDYMVVAKVRERPAVSKQVHGGLMWKDLFLGS